MYRIKDKISNPGAYGFNVLPSLEVIVRDAQGLKKLNEKSYFYENNQPMEQFFFDGKMITTDWMGNYALIDANSKQVINSGKGQGFFEVSETYLGTELVQDSPQEFGLLNKDFKWLSKWQRKKHSNVNFLLSDTWILLESLQKCFALTVGQEAPLWDFSFDKAETVKFSHFAGYYKGNVAITLNNGTFILLNAANGQVYKHFPDTGLILGIAQSEPGNAVFYGLHHQLFVEINAEQGKIIRKTDVSTALHQLAKDPVFVRRARLYNNQFYFIAGKSYVGVFDIASASIQWLHKLEFSSKNCVIPVGADKIQLHGNTLYVMDSSGDLHVFERNE